MQSHLFTLQNSGPFYYILCLQINHNRMVMLTMCRASAVCGAVHLQQSYDDMMPIYAQMGIITDAHLKTGYQFKKT